MRFFRMALICLLLLAGVMALGGVAQAAGLQPCVLITRAEAAKILGEAVKPARKRKVVGMAGGRGCTYFTAAPLAQRGGTGSVEIVVYDKQSMKDSAFTSPTEFYRRLLSAGRKAKALIQEISVPGGEGYWSERGRSLHILVNDVYLVLRVHDLKKISAADSQELRKKVSEHCRQVSLAAARRYIFPRLGGK